MSSYDERMLITLQLYNMFKHCQKLCPLQTNSSCTPLSVLAGKIIHPLQLKDT